MARLHEHIRLPQVGLELPVAPRTMNRRHNVVISRHGRSPMISLSPSTIWVISSGEASPIRSPSFSTDRVRIWLIFAQDRFGNPFAFSPRVRGNPVCWGGLVMATAITVPECALNTL